MTSFRTSTRQGTDTFSPLHIPRSITTMFDTLSLNNLQPRDQLHYNWLRTQLKNLELPRTWTACKSSSGDPHYMPVRKVIECARRSSTCTTAAVTTQTACMPIDWGGGTLLELCTALLIHRQSTPWTTPTVPSLFCTSSVFRKVGTVLE